MSSVQVPIRLLALPYLLLASIGYAAEAPCEFDGGSLRFVGEPVAQARCLLRDVGPWARIGPLLESLPAPLESLIGQEVSITRDQLEEYLERRGLDEADLGGPIDHELSRANSGSPDADQATYFVIHDVSTPNYEEAEFPSDINESSWRYNDLAIWENNQRAHVFVNRLGDSVSPVHFSRPWRATKFELQYGNEDPKGLFLHVELIQPRRSAANGPAGNDAVAPSPGFMDPQYARLALLYVTASVRKGEWLIPAFHAVLDAGRKGAHDDPQNFLLSRWAAELQEILNADEF